MDKIYSVIILKDRSCCFNEDNYYENSFAFKKEEDAKDHLKSCYDKYLNSMLTEMNMELKDIEEEEICSLNDDNFVIGCEGGLVYYYGLVKEVTVQ